MEECIGDWIGNKIDILNFAQPFSSVLKKAKYFSGLPPQKQFPNHKSCDKFSDFIF